MEHIILLIFNFLGNRDDLLNFLDINILYPIGLRGSATRIPKKLEGNKICMRRSAILLKAKILNIQQDYLL